MINRLVIWMIRHRFIILGGIIIITIFFATQIPKIEIKTKLEDLLPQEHSFLKVHSKYEKQLGTPFKIYLMLKVRNGDVYSQETLKKCQEIADALDAIPGVDHNQVYSIASRKVKRITVTSDSILTENLMKTIPATKEEMTEFQDIVRNVGGVYGVWVSRDEKALLFSAAFIPRLTEVEVLFDALQAIRKQYTDANYELHVAGEPVLNGWIKYFQQKESLPIFVVTFIVFLLLLVFYFRNWVGVVVPFVSTALGTIWGLGFCGILGRSLEPLTLVLPLLIAARTLSHSVQITERYFECYDERKEVIPACIECSQSIFPPGLLGITTDAIGILLIAVAPIPIMQNLAYICFWWAISIFPCVLIFSPILCSYLPVPKNIPEIVNTERGQIQKLLGGIAKLGYGKSGIITFTITAILFVLCFWVSTKVNIGDIRPGSPILWPDSAYNVAIDQINKNFPGTEELYVIFEGSGGSAIEAPGFLDILELFQRHMEEDPKVGLTFSIRDLLPRLSKNVFGGYFKFDMVPSNINKTATLFYLLRNNSAPSDFDLYLSREDKDANVIIWFKDHMGDTIREGISLVKQFMKEKKDDLAKAKVTIQLASGNIGLLAAINETVAEAQYLNGILVLLTVFLMCAVTYRSWLAAIILMIPLNLSNVMTMSIMKWMDIGFNINTLPIVSVGVGVGIDYGIYLLTRICEESQTYGGYSLQAITKAAKTTGKAIFFTATTMISGVIFWYFLSSLRFQAEMGLLLCLIMTINMLGALLCIPAMVYVFKPKFLLRQTALSK